MSKIRKIGDITLPDEIAHKIRKIGDVDRFSSLPDEIAHKIIDCIWDINIIRLSAVSKRCRQLCLTAPFLRVHSGFVKNSPTTRAQLMNYVDRVWCLREAKHIDSIAIYWVHAIEEEQAYRILSWLHRAALCNPKEIIFHMFNQREGLDFTLPTSFLSCKSLETLSYGFQNGKGFGNFKIPSNVGFSYLKCLIFIAVRVDESFFKWISRCCKCLENLKLVSTRGTKNITVTSPSLKVLTLNYPYFDVDIQVYAEKLEKIHLILMATPEGRREPKLFIPNIQTLHKVLLRYTNDYVDMHEVRNKSFSGLSRFDQVLESLRKFSSALRCLRMFGDSIKKLIDERSLPIKMPNLTVLILGMTRANVDIVLHMEFIFKGTPNLKHLIIQGDDDANETMGRRLDRKNSFPLLPMLKDVTFLFPFCVQKRKLELIKHLINPGRKIDVNVICTPPLPCDVNAQLKGFKNATVNVILQESVSLLI